jgi:hypothetical protein
MAEIASLASLLSELAQDTDVRGLGEQATKHAFILPILELLGWR